MNKMVVSAVPDFLLLLLIILPSTCFATCLTQHQEAEPQEVPEANQTASPSSSLTATLLVFYFYFFGCCFAKSWRDLGFKWSEEGFVSLVFLCFFWFT